METIRTWNVDLILESVGGYIHDMDAVRETLDEILRADDPLSELDLKIDITDGMRKVDLRILYNVMARK